MIKLLPIILLLGACNPLLGAGSFIHSILTGNTVGIVTGAGGMAVEKTTGKSVAEHILDEVNSKKKPEPIRRLDMEWIFQEGDK